MLDYAAEDVVHLVELTELLLADLEKRGRKNWALKLSAELADRSRFEPDGRAIAEKLGGGGHIKPREYEVLKHLCQWREERIRKANIPRRWLAEDRALVQLARTQPKRPEDLEAFHGAGLKVKGNGADAILRVVERAMSVPESELEEPPRKLDPSPRESAALSVLKCFLNFLAQENEIPLRYLVDNDTTLLLLRGEFQSTKDLEDSGLLSPGALEVFGEELLAMLNGRRALKIQDGRPHRFDPGEPSNPGRAVGAASHGARRRRFSK
jgi:ribonuclease D